jgi:hypothetical protein
VPKLGPCWQLLELQTVHLGNFLNSILLKVQFSRLAHVEVGVSKRLPMVQSNCPSAGWRPTTLGRKQPHPIPPP